MKIHEFQAKETLKKFGVPVQDGIAIKSMLEFDDAIVQTSAAWYKSVCG